MHPNRLSFELHFYETHKTEWLKNHGNEFVVVKEDAVLGFLTSFYDAYCAGTEKYGASVDFLVKRIVPQEPVFMVFGQ